MQISKKKIKNKKMGKNVKKKFTEVKLEQPIHEEPLKFISNRRNADCV